MVQINYFWHESYQGSKYTNLYVWIKNLSPKTIKYCSISFCGYNSVGDPIETGVGKDNASANVQAVGPLEGNTESDMITFENVWYSPVKVSNVKPKILLIEYMDGTYEAQSEDEIEPIPKKEPTPASAPTKSGGCYVATCVYGSYDCPQVWTLRRFRDDTLASTWYGRAFIRTYYAISPTLVKCFGKTTWFKKMWQGKLDRMVENLRKQGVEDTPYQDKNW